MADTERQIWDGHRWATLADHFGENYPVLTTTVETLVQTDTGKVLVIDSKVTRPDYSGRGGYGISYSRGSVG